MSLVVAELSNPQGKQCHLLIPNQKVTGGRHFESWMTHNKTAAVAAGGKMVAVAVGGKMAATAAGGKIAA